MDFEYILGGITASTMLLLFVLFSSASKKEAKALAHAENNGGTMITTTSENGNQRQQISPTLDIIIVGAGVAGAALACTLGKVEQSGNLFFSSVLK